MFSVWKRSPLLRIFAPLAIGVLVQFKLELGASLLMLTVFLTLLFAVIVLFGRLKPEYSRRHIPGIIFLICAVPLGMLLTHLNDERLSKDHFVHQLSEESIYKIRLTDFPASKEKSVKVIADVMGVVENGLEREVRGRLLVYLQKDSAAQKLSAGDEIVIRASPAKTAIPKNPGEFNYAGYLARHNMWYQVYVRAEDWRIIGHSGSLLTWMKEVREHLLVLFLREGVEGREYAVLSALVLGKTTEIDTDLLSSYSNAGAVHILAVSGLHVALVYMILSPMLRRIFPKGKMRMIKSLIPITLLWTYAGLTGFSPSVLRAALMFTCFIIADNFQKQNNIYNTMSASALVLIVWDPMILFEVGFQLSYLAVLGIVLLQKKMTSIFYSPIWLVQWAWKLTAVSVAAQISTLPLTLAYFHQFPTWFIPINLVVIPLSTLILYVSLSFFALSWWPSLGHFLAGLSSFLTRLMNEAVVLVDVLPYPIISGIELNGLEVLFLSAILITSCCWLLWKMSGALFPLMIAVALMMANGLMEDVQTKRQHEICFHSIRGHDGISFITGGKMVFIADSLLAADDSKQRFHCEGYKVDKHIQCLSILRLDSLSVTSADGLRIVPPFLQCGHDIVFLAEPKNLSLLARVEDAVCYFTSAWNSCYADSSTFAGLKGKTVLFSSSIKPYQVKRLLKYFPNSTKVFDLSERAVMFRCGRLLYFDDFDR